MFKFLSITFQIIVLFAHLVHLQARYVQSESDYLHNEIAERRLVVKSTYRIKLCSGNVKCIENVTVADLAIRFAPQYDVWPSQVQNVACLYCYNSKNEKFYTDTVKDKRLIFTKKKFDECFSKYEYYEFAIGCGCSSYIVLNETASETNRQRNLWPNEDNWENSQPFLNANTHIYTEDP